MDAWLLLLHITCQHCCDNTSSIYLVQSLPAECVPDLPHNTTLLVPAAPILKDDNWPLLTISKGFFETLAAKGGGAAGALGAPAAAAGAAAAAAAATAAELDENELEGAGWGDELELGGGEADAEGGAGVLWLDLFLKKNLKIISYKII